MASGLPPDARLMRKVFGDDVVLRTIVAQIPPICRVRLLGVCRRWDRFLLEELSVEGAPRGSTISLRNFAFLLRRAGPRMRSLDVSSAACAGLSGEQIILTIEGAARASDDPLALTHFIAWRSDRPAASSAQSPAFSFDAVERLRSACPALQRASCSLALAHVEELELALELLGSGGCHRLVFDGYVMRESLRPADAEQVAKYLNTSEALGSIELVANPIGDSGARLIAAALAANTSLTALQLVDCALGAEAADALASALACPESLASSPAPRPAASPGGGDAGLARTPPSASSGVRLGSGASRRSLLSRGSLRLSSSGSSRSGLNSGGGITASKRISSSLAAAFAGTTGNWALRALSLASNGDVGKLGAHHLARALAGGCMLTALDLTSCHVGPAGARALASALRDNYTLADLRLGLNDIVTEGARAVSDLLACTSSLRHLDLHSNELGDEGAVALSEGLALNNSLTSLILYENDLTSAGVRALSEALAANVSLTRLDLRSDDRAHDAVLEEAMSLDGLLGLRTAVAAAAAAGSGGDAFGGLPVLDEEAGEADGQGAADMDLDESMGSLGSLSSLLSSSSGGEDGGEESSGRRQKQGVEGRQDPGGGGRKWHSGDEKKGGVG